MTETPALVRLKSIEIKVAALMKMNPLLHPTSFMEDVRLIVSMSISLSRDLVHALEGAETRIAALERKP